MLLHPIRAMLDRPVYAFAISAPVAIGYFVFAFLEHRPYYGGFVETASTLDDYLYVTLLVLFIPYIIFHELEVRKIRQIEDQVPEFLKRLASINGTGILLADAIAITAQSNMGRLKSEIKRTVADIRWNSNLVEALKHFETRIRTNMTRRSLTLIAKASESTGDIHQVISTVADDADIEKNLKKERSAEMFIYVFIIFVTFCVFLVIVYVLAAFFLPALDGSSNPAMSMGGFDLKEYTLLFFHAALLQGFGSGLVAGKMGSGSISSGLKHSLAMMSVSYVLFIVFI
ncbi:type II secretion system F family protein [Methanosarcina horonobensis]|uniref:type II secretion system F family protein n=1 Tax=Methanosarcina horonobensis TaxID=418008 RepID=UPI000A507C19|nr:type II secretion system F family protein [Methanosarcina horonobensis]